MTDEDTSFNFKTDGLLDEIKDIVVEAFKHENNKVRLYTEEQMKKSIEGAFMSDYRIVISIPVELNGKEGNMDIILEKKKDE